MSNERWCRYSNIWGGGSCEFYTPPTSRWKIWKLYLPCAYFMATYQGYMLIWYNRLKAYGLFQIMLYALYDNCTNIYYFLGIFAQRVSLKHSSWLSDLIIWLESMVWLRHHIMYNIWTLNRNIYCRFCKEVKARKSLTNRSNYDVYPDLLTGLLCHKQWCCTFLNCVLYPEI